MEREEISQGITTPTASTSRDDWNEVGMKEYLEKYSGDFDRLVHLAKQHRPHKSKADIRWSADGDDAKIDDVEGVSEVEPIRMSATDVPSEWDVDKD